MSRSTATLTDAELEALRAFRAEGVPVAEIARRLGRARSTLFRAGTPDVAANRAARTRLHAERLEAVRGMLDAVAPPTLAEVVGALGCSHQTAAKLLDEAGAGRRTHRPLMTGEARRIRALRAAGKGRVVIAKALGRHPGTLGRVLRRIDEEQAA